MTSSTVNCPACRVTLKWSTAAPEGQRIRCPKCSHVFTPGASAAETTEKIAPATPVTPADTISASRGPVASLLATEEHRSDDVDENDVPLTHDFLHPAQEPGDLGRLNHYRVIKVLGAGGMGLVYLGEDFLLKRPVAIKVMLPEYAKKASAKQRFLREARAAAAIEHDHIIPIFEVNEDNGVPYLVMPLLKGESLADRLKRHKSLPLADVVLIAQEIALGLAEAHEHGLIHRDIKPSNVWMETKAVEEGARTSSFRAKILDFGLARTLETDGKLTKSGTVLGTPAYMSPEQARNPNVDARADLFSLGVMIYQMATGSLPFQGHDMLSFLAAVTFDAPRPPRDRNPEISQDFNDLILKLLEKDPANRIQTAGEVADRLAAMAAKAAPRSAIVASAPSVTSLVDDSPTSLNASRRRRVWPFVAIGLVMLAGVGLLATKIVREKTKDDGESNDAKIVVEAKDNPTIVAEETLANDPPRVEPFVESASEDLLDWNFAKGAPPPAVAPFDAAQAAKHQKDWATFLNVPVEASNDLGMKFRLIPPGEFETKDAAGKLLKVRVIKPFYLGTTEVTIEQFGKFVDETKYVSDAEQHGIGKEPFTWRVDPQFTWRTPGYEISEPLAVTQITVNDAQAFCRWLASKDKIAYRLPRGREWELAARGGGTGDHGWCPTSKLAEFAWLKQSQDDKMMTQPVGLKNANPFGLFDVLGNSWEWCHDIGYFTRRGGAWGGSFDKTFDESKVSKLSFSDSTSANQGFRVCRPVFSKPEDSPFDSVVLTPRGQALSPASLVSRPTPILGLRSWSVELRRPIAPDAIRSLDWSPDGAMIASADRWNSSVRVYDAKGVNLKILPCNPSQAIESVAWSPDGKWLAAADRSRLWLWDTNSFVCRAAMPAAGMNSHLAFSPDQKSLACFGWQGAKLIELDTGFVFGFGTVPANTKLAGLNYGVWSSDSKKLLCLVMGQSTVELWDVKTRQREASWRASNKLALSVAWLPDDKRCVTLSDDGFFRIWDVGTQTKLKDYQVGNMRRLAQSPKRDFLWITGDGDSAYTWDGIGPPQSKELRDSISQPFAYQPGGGQFVTLSRAWGLTFRHAISGQVISQVPKAGAASVAFPEWSGTIFGSGTVLTRTRQKKDMVQVWDSTTGCPRGSSELRGELWFPSPNGDAVLVATAQAPATDDVNLWLYDGKTGQRLRDFSKHPGRFELAAWSMDGAKIATVGDDRIIRTWDAASGQLESSLTGHSARIDRLAWSPDGKHIASLGAEVSLRVWSLDNPKTPEVITDFAKVRESLGSHDLVWLNGREILMGLSGSWLVWDVAEKKWARIVRDAGRNRTLIVAPNGALQFRRDYDDTGFRSSATGELYHPWADTQAFDAIREPRIALGHDGRIALFGPFGHDFETKQRLGVLLPHVRGNLWLCVGPDGHWRGGSLDQPGDGTMATEIAAIEPHLFYIAQTDAGEWITLNSTEFQKRFGWKNEPSKTRFLEVPSQLAVEKLEPVDPPAERRAADWLIRQMNRGVSFEVRVDKETSRRAIVANSQLPKNSFVIEKLQIENSDISDNELAALADCRGLLEVRLNRTPQITEKGLKHLRSSRKLTKLTLSELPVGPDVSKSLAFWNQLEELSFHRIPNLVSMTKPLPEMPNLKNLSFLSMNLESDTVLGWVRKAPQVERLNVTGIAPTDLSILKPMKNLKHLACRGREMNETIGEVLKDLPNLRSLHFHSPVNDRALAGALKVADRLTNLTFDIWDPADRQITRVGLGHISKLKAVNEIVVYGYPSFLTDEALALFAEMPNLRTLDLRYRQDFSPGFSADALQSFRKRRPDVQVRGGLKI